MKNNILMQYQTLKRESNDIAKRIRKCKYNSDSEKKLKEEYNRQYDKLCERQLNIEKMIDKLEPTERLLIRLRYFDNMKWDKIFKIIHYSQKQTFRIHDKAIRKLNKL